MPPDALFQRLAVALAIGLLVGLERGWKSREEAEGERTAGLRTYALSGLLGGICAVLGTLTTPLVLGLSFVTFGAALAAFHYLEASTENDYSVTGVVAGLLTFALGAYAVLGDVQVAIAAAVAMTLLLALKQPLHTWLRRLTWPEIRAFFILLAMTFLLLPLLPDRPVDPWQAVNPTEIWLLAILIAGVSFVGYVAMRVMGDEAGVALAALAGGLASSTATTLTFARMARQYPDAAAIAAGGTLIAGAVMAGRVVVIASALNPALLIVLAWPLGAAGAVLAAAGVLLVFRGAPDGERPAIAMKSPFELATALKLAGFIALVMVLAKIASAQFGAAGIYALAALSGLADVDALTLSLARMAREGLGLHAAAVGIGIAAATNTIVKAGMAALLGSLRHAAYVGVASAAAIGAGAVALLVAPQ